MEQARCEAIGANQMPGVKQNLNEVMAEKCRRLGYDKMQTREDANLADALHFHVRRHLTGEDIPGSAQKLNNQWKEYFTKALPTDFLDTLKNNIDNQAAYADLSPQRPRTFWFDL